MRLLSLAWSVAFLACAAGREPDRTDRAFGAPDASAGADTAEPADGSVFDVADREVQTCPTCSADGRSVIGCDGKVQKTCDAGEACAGGACLPACDAAKVNKSSVGCDYYAVAMAGQGPASGGCFVSFVANTSDRPAKITASFGSTPIDLAQYAKIPKGSGTTLEYAAFDPAVGLPPNEVAIVFLAHDPKGNGAGMGQGVKCPITPALTTGAYANMPFDGAKPYQVVNTARTGSFHLTTTEPVVAYQMLPYGGGNSMVTGATLLLPTSAWDTNYVAAMAYQASWAYLLPPVLSIVAREDDTNVTILPTGDIRGYGSVVPAAKAGVPVTYKLSAGEVLQLTEGATTTELTGSPIQSDKPIGVLGGHFCLNVPNDRDYCDHAEQMIAPVRALGSEYVAAGHRDRVASFRETHVYRLVGAVDGTALTFEPKIAGAPEGLSRGQIVELRSEQPFVVKSQDAAHPFMAFTYMTGSSTVPVHTWMGAGGYGDADFVRLVPAKQYLEKYVFFTDPTYPNTNLIAVRKRGTKVTLDCLGEVTGFAPVGSGEYEVASIDLVKGNFEAQGACDNGRHVMESTEPFGLFVWGWGGPETAGGVCDRTAPGNTCDVSYGYPAGENVSRINDVVVEPRPK